MLEHILLEPRQEKLLIALVEAARSVEPEVFLLHGFWIEHSGFKDSMSRGVHRGDIESLAEAGLLRIYRDNNYYFDVTPQGFRYYAHLKEKLGQPVQQVEATVHNFLNADAFQKKYPLAYQKWAEAEKLLWSTDSEQQLTTIGHLCREAIQEFVTALVERYKPSDITNDKAKIIARTKAVLAVQSKKPGDRVEKFLEALINYLGTTHDLIQRQEHGGQKEGEPLVWEDARRVVFNTAMVMFELDHALS